ncbi:mannitol-1-phosphate 5-dehydrogenase [Salimicrobium sp. PL1-032A]|uniref:mannitol-1-phosphate 5-dehydrogenase n=1 Tax=Salimicrobium sp. PL1-032A TaxID=3095364 RepID=UPI0032609F49
MRAVHFGAGNIGRGFIGELLFKSGYHTTFVDVNAEIIDALNEEKEYTVYYAGSGDKLTVTNVSGINSSEDPDAVTEAIQEADIVTTAVGPNILPLIAGTIAGGLKNRPDGKPLPVIACENMIGGSTLLQEEILKHTETEVVQKASFPDSAVDRIVPIQHNEKLLDVSVEPYFEWIVEEGDIKGEKPEVEGITYVEELEPYIERKLFSVNTGHAATAYKGSAKGYETILQAMDDEDIVRHVRGTLKETGDVLVARYGFDRKAHGEYIDKIIERFQNPDLSDYITRVARGPIRKLGLKDRLVRPARTHFDVVKEEPAFLVDTIVAALFYENPEDEEAVKLKALREEKGAVGALKELTGLDEQDSLIQAVAKRI